MLRNRSSEQREADLDGKKPAPTRATQEMEAQEGKPIGRVEYQHRRKKLHQRRFKRAQNKGIGFRTGFGQESSAKEEPKV